MNDLEKHITSVEKFLRENKWGTQPPSLYEPIHYMMELGGKRLRPLLTVMAYSLFKNDAVQIIPQAAAVEVFHNFTLIHDDIMDKAPLRRGKKSVHEKWNVNTAILSGDVLMVKVYQIFCSLEPKVLKAVLLLFNQCATEVCEGQQIDMEFETRKQVDVNEYIDMIRQKTAVLLGFALELGALLAGANEKQKLTLRNLGVNIGIGFQLKDDLLDVYGDKKTFGKQVGGDIISNKKTFLLIKALERAKGKDKTELEKWLKTTKVDPAKKVKAVTRIYDKLDIKSQTEIEIDNYFTKGLGGLQALPKSANRDKLGQFILTLMKRQN